MPNSVENGQTFGNGRSWMEDPRVNVKGVDEARGAAFVEINARTEWMVTAGKLGGARVVISGITGEFEYMVPVERDNRR